MKNWRQPPNYRILFSASLSKVHWTFFTFSWQKEVLRRKASACVKIIVVARPALGNLREEILTFGALRSACV